MAARPVQLFLASHPGPVVAVTAASAAYAFALGRGALGVATAMAAVLAGQLSIGWHNDWLDAERDQAAGRLDKPIARGRLERGTVALAAVLAAGATVPLSLLSGWRAGLVHIAAVSCGWCYNMGLKATVVSFLPFVVAFGLLPVFVSLGGPGAPLGPWWAPASAALLGAGAHLMNALPDLEQDLAAGVRGLPHRLGRQRSLAAAALLLLAASAVLTLRAGAPAIAGVAGGGTAIVCVVLALVAARRRASRAPFGLAIAVALVDVALLLVDGRALR